MVKRINFLLINRFRIDGPSQCFQITIPTRQFPINIRTTLTSLQKKATNDPTSSDFFSATVTNHNDGVQPPQFGNVARAKRESVDGDAPRHCPSCPDESIYNNLQQRLENVPLAVSFYGQADLNLTLAKLFEGPRLNGCVCVFECVA